MGEDARRALCALAGLAAATRHPGPSGLNADVYFSQFLKLQDHCQHGRDASEGSLSLISSGSEERERKLSLLKRAIIPFVRPPLP